MAYQVILEPAIGQFREFEPRRVHTRINSLGLFLVHKLTCGKRESVRQQHSMKNRRAVGSLNPMRFKIEGKDRGGKGTTPVSTACPEAAKYRCAKKKKNGLGSRLGLGLCCGHPLIY